MNIGKFLANLRQRYFAWRVHREIVTRIVPQIRRAASSFVPVVELPPQVCVMGGGELATHDRVL